MEFHSISSEFSSLFSTILTFYTLILLYLPSLFFTILLSPVINSTAIILLSLLRLGANQKLQQKSSSIDYGILDAGGNQRLENESSCLESGVVDHTTSSSTESRFLDFVDQAQIRKEESELKSGLGHACDQTYIEYEPKYGLHMECKQTHVGIEHDMGLESNSMESYYVIEGEGTKEGMDPKQMAFLEWNMRAPLEIIYEAYEGEEDDDDDENHENNEDFGNKRVTGCERYPSLSMCYPDSETNSSSDDDFPMNENWETYESVFSKWEEEEEEEREELIEISLDRYGKRSIEICHSEEDNLIEINIFPTIS